MFHPVAFLSGAARAFLEVVRFHMAAPPLVSCTQILGYTFTVSPWQGRRHGFEGGRTISRGEQAEKFLPPPFAYTRRET